MALSARIEADLPKSPALLSPTAWYRPESLADLAEGAAVAQWDDSSGNGRHLVQTTAGYRPVVRHGFVAGRSCLSFDGSNDYLSSDGFTLGDLIDADEGTVFVVFLRKSSDDASYGFLVTGDTGTPQTLMVYAYTDGKLYGSNGDAGGTDYTGGVALTSDAWAIGLWQHGGGNIYTGVNDLDSAALVSAASGDTVASNLDDTVFVGGHSTTSFSLDGYVAEVIAFDTALSEADRREVVRYLVEKYALTGNETTAPAENWTDLSEDVVSDAKCFWGIDSFDPNDRVASPGELSFDVDNSDQNAGGIRGYYSNPRIRRPGFGMGTPVRVVLTHDLYGDAVSWVGSIDAVTPGAGARGNRASVVCLDWMALAAKAKLSGIAVQIDQQADELFETVVATIEKAPPGGTQVWAGSDEYPYALDDVEDEKTKVSDVFDALARSEYGYVYHVAGITVFEGRRRRGGSGSAAYSFDEDEDIVAVGLQYEQDSVLNRVQVAIYPRRRDAAATTVLFSLVNSVEILRGTSKTIQCPYRDPAQTSQRTAGVDMVTPVKSTDYLFNSLEDGTGDDLVDQLTVSVSFGGNSATATITNNGPRDGYIPAAGFQLRGRGLYDFEPILTEASDADSIAATGESPIRYEMPYQSSVDNATDVAAFLLGLFKAPKTRVSEVSFYANWSDETADAAFYADVSSRIAITLGSLGIEAEGYFINGVALELRLNGQVLVTYKLAPTSATEVWILDEPGRTELNETTILGFGIFVPSWILDSSELGTDTVLA